VWGLILNLVKVPKPSIAQVLNDKKVRGAILQVAMLLAVVFGFYWLVDNTLTNLGNQGKSLGFNFLSSTAGFQISQTFGTWLFEYEVGRSTYWEVYFIGIANTFLVAVLGIFVATIIGFTMGVMRLSNNVIFKTFATTYIEILRNIPILLQLFFWYFAVLRAMPGKREKFEIIPDFAGLNITGMYLPAPKPEDGFGLVLIALAVSVLLILGLRRYARQKQEKTGQILPVFWLSFGVLMCLPGLVYFALGSPLGWEIPEFKETGPMLQRGYQPGLGMILVPEMLAVWLALSLYTAAFIAEIVRAGILAVSKGQTEAAFALGIRPNFTLRLIIIPQALRVIIPPLTSQYLNITKNSSLAVAIAYPELVSVFAGTALNQVGKEIEMIFMMMMVYLTFSLLTAGFMNWYNSKVKLVER
jgi:general L-amino acid transport system permease protein